MTQSIHKWWMEREDGEHPIHTSWRSNSHQNDHKKSVSFLESLSFVCYKSRIKGKEGVILARNACHCYRYNSESNLDA